MDTVAKVKDAVKEIEDPSDEDIDLLESLVKPIFDLQRNRVWVLTCKIVAAFSPRLHTISKAHTCQLIFDRYRPEASLVYPCPLSCYFHQTMWYRMLHSIKFSRSVPDYDSEGEYS